MAALGAALSALAHCGRGQALGEALSALAHCGCGQALDHLAEAQGRPLAAVLSSLGRGRRPVWGEAGAGAALALGAGPCHDNWGQVRDPGLAVMG